MGGPKSASLNVTYKEKKYICIISYMSDHVLLNLLNELREKKGKMGGLSSLSLSRNEFN